MHALLKGRGPTPPGLEAIRDLTVAFTYPDVLDIAFTRQSGADHEQIQFWQEGQTERGDWLDLSGAVTIAPVQDNTVQLCHVRGVNAAGKVGPTSNIARFSPELSSFTPRDNKLATYLGNSAGNLGVNLDAMVGGALTRSVGDLLVIVAHHHQVQNTLIPAAMTLPAGWLSAAFAGLISTDAMGVRLVYKICDGTETVVPMIDVVGTTGNQRINYHAFAFDVTGTLELGSPVPVPQVTNSDPAAKAVEIAKEGNNAVLVIASGAGTASVPSGPTSTWTAPVTFSETYENSATAVVRSRCSYRIGPAASTKANITVDFADHGLNSCVFAYFVARSAE